MQPVQATNMHGETAGRIIMVGMPSSTKGKIVLLTLLHAGISASTAITVIDSWESRLCRVAGNTV